MRMCKGGLEDLLAQLTDDGLCEMEEIDDEEGPNTTCGWSEHNHGGKLKKYSIIIREVKD